VTTLIGFASIPQFPGCTGLGGFRKTLFAGAAFLFVASAAEAAPFSVNAWSNNPPAVSPPASNPQVRKKSAPRPASASKGSKEDAKAPFGDIPKGPLQLVVSIGQQHVTLFSNGVRVAQSPVSTGTPGHPTPTGVFSIIEKDRWHRSNLYQSAPMFYMQRLTWSGVAMHEGMLPGFAASHGCIRMPTSFASKLWVTTKLGVRVVVARSDVAPYEFSHPKLFNPMVKPVEAKLSNDRPADALRSTLATDNAAASAARRPMQMAQVSNVANDGNREADLEAELPVLPEPIEEVSPPPDADPARRPAAAVEPDVESTGSMPPANESPKAAAPAPEVARPGTAHVVPSAPSPAVKEPEKSEPPTSEPAKPPRTRVVEPTKRSGQVAVFVSKKEKKIFVRHGHMPIFDMPIEIADPDQPLGTHVFTAMEVLDSGTRMRWNAITMPDPPRNAAADTSKNKKTANNKKPEPAPRRPAEYRQPSTAQQALDRVNIPQEAIDVISEFLAPGSSLVISDEGLGRETGRYTEFIVLTR